MVNFPLTQSSWLERHPFPSFPLPLLPRREPSVGGVREPAWLPGALSLIWSRFQRLEGPELRSLPRGCDHPAVAAGPERRVPSSVMLLQGCFWGAGQSLPRYPTLQIFLDRHHGHALSPAQLMPPAPPLPSGPLALPPAWITATVGWSPGGRGADAHCPPPPTS